VDDRERVREQFGRNVRGYRDDALFAAGDDLRRLVALAGPTGSERVLDVGCGAGHTALAFAPHVREVVGVDVTPEMVATAAELARSRGLDGASFVVAAAEALPFPDRSFDLVTCRFAAHHFADLKRALAEAARVLVPTGAFLLVDHVAPEDDEQDAFVNTLDRLRDPSHVREWRLSELEGAFAEAGLGFTLVDTWALPLELESWFRRAGTPPDARAEVVALLQGAGPAVAQAFDVVCDETGAPCRFSLRVALVVGRGAGDDVRGSAPGDRRGGRGARGRGGSPPPRP
jgi:SAM-dependent methyltransferase